MRRLTAVPAAAVLGLSARRGAGPADRTVPALAAYTVGISAATAGSQGPLGSADLAARQRVLLPGDSNAIPIPSAIPIPPQAKVDLELVAEDPRDSQLQSVNYQELIVTCLPSGEAP
jgi:hypothetical protein